MTKNYDTLVLEVYPVSTLSLDQLQRLCDATFSDRSAFLSLLDFVQRSGVDPDYAINTLGLLADDLSGPVLEASLWSEMHLSEIRSWVDGNPEVYREVVLSLYRHRVSFPQLMAALDLAPSGIDLCRIDRFVEWIKPMTLRQRIRCKVMKRHEWTTKAELGIEPSAREVHGDSNDNRTYLDCFCIHCGTKGEALPVPPSIWG